MKNDLLAIDSATMISLGGDSSLLFAFERAVLAAAAIGGELYTASYEDTAVAGVAAWFPPGQDPFSTYVHPCSMFKNSIS